MGEGAVVLSCKECKKAVHIPSKVVGEWIGECRALPPVPIVIPTDRGLVNQSLFPRVVKENGCFLFEKIKRESILSMN